MDMFMSGISEIVNGLISMVGREIGLMREYESELEKLRRTLDTIQAYSEDAEKRQVGNERVWQWLKRLKTVAYDAEDILDEVEYQTLRRKMEKKRDYTISFQPLAFRRNVAHRIQVVNETLKGLTTEMQAFNLNKGEGSKNASSETTSAAVNWRETFSLTDYSQVFGRENDVKKIKEMLLSNIGLNISHQADHDETVTVIPIVGFGGLGKTTLAQILFKDEEVEKYFEIKKWVSVSNHSGDTTLLKIVAKALCGTDRADLSTKEQMLRSLETKLAEVKKKNQKFLLILDDVWNEQSGNRADTYFRDQWDDLKLALKQCVAGCRIVVTTRSTNVARIMGTTVSPYHHLDVLSEDDCWAIFEKWAFRRGAQRSPALENIGREIVKKCGGVPLVAKTLGASLNSKQSPEAWLSIKDSETLINITSGDDSNIVRVLKLSYDHLSPPLRRCFSYCAIFPKGTKIEKEVLIRMWIAQGFLQSSNGNDIENVGNDYFNTLCGSCFFQDIEAYNEEIWACKMHDLMHDLAQSTSGKECLVVDSNANDISETYHLWVDNVDFSKLNWGGKNLERLRTFVGKANVDLSKFKCLRVLVLRSERGIETLPAAVGNLVHLRYLHIDSPILEALPTSICQLYKLQILHVAKCYELKELPTDLWKLINLRYLIVLPCTKTPKGVGRLTDLRELRVLTLWENGCGIEELENLNHLRGRLYICGLENVRTVESAEKARLKEKKNVNSLELVWDGKNDSVNYDEVLEAMQPPPMLSKMSMIKFPGGNLPKWLTNSSMLPYLIELNLLWCPAITSIDVSGCGCLKKLSVYGCDNLKVIISTPLPSLEILWVQYIHGLVIDEAFGNSNLKKLWIRDCPCVMSLNIRECRSLQELKLQNCPGVKITHFDGLTALPDWFGTPSSLHTLVISHWANLTQFGSTTAHPFRSLHTLEISHCDNLTQFVSTTTTHLFPSLTILNISHCDNLTQFVSTTTPHSFPSLYRLSLAYVCGTFVESVIKSLTSLRSLSVEGVPDLTTLPIGFSLNNKELHHIELKSCPGFRDEDGLQLMTSLTTLTIEDCQSVTSLDFMRGLVSLRWLTVLNCKGIVISSDEDLESPESLSALELGGFSEDLDYFPFPTRPMQCLEDLNIKGWPKLVSLPQQLQHLTKLQRLRISNFDGLIALPDWIGKLSSLEKLDIHCCKNLMHLPSKKDMQRLTSLSMEITDCPNLTKRYMEGGEERCKIPTELLAGLY